MSDQIRERHPRPSLELYPRVDAPKSAVEATWDEIERLADHDPACRQAIIAVHQKRATKEEALIMLVFHHYNAYATMVRERVNELMNRPSGIFLMRE